MCRYLCRCGVFVIETKNMKGWIFRSPQQKIGLKRFIGIPLSFKIINTRKRSNQY
ncbi:MAG: nuclease-related domain-containing protein [Methylococcales bacterium]